MDRPVLVIRLLTAERRDPHVDGFIDRSQADRSRSNRDYKD